MPTSKHPDPSFVVLGMHAENQLDVFVRSEDHELHQAARIATHNGVSPASMTAVMADLADTFGWRQVATAPPGVPQPDPPGRALQAPTREARSAAADRASTRSLPPGMVHGKDTKAIYIRIMKALDEAHPAGLRFHEVHSVVGRSRSSGQVYGYLSTLVKRKLVTRPAEGLYVAARQRALPVDGHPAVMSRGKNSGGKAGRNVKHAVTVEQVVDYVTQHPEGVSASQIADALLPNDEQSRHTISNRLIAYYARTMRNGEPFLIHKVTDKGEGGVVRVTYYPGPD